MLKNKKRNVITLGILFTIIGLYLVSYNYLNEKVDKAYNSMNLQILALNEQNIDTSELEEKTEQLNNKNNINNNTSSNKQTNNNKEDIYEKYYVAKLSIPKINLEKGLVDLNSPYNDLNKNIQMIETSEYPTVSGSNLILASHAGTNSVSYFRNLYKLVKGDKCYLSYEGKTYTYEIVNIYYEKKDGNIAIYRDGSKTTLTLITCTRGSNTKQTVYIAELIDVK